jgi:hypothetical protein
MAALLAILVRVSAMDGISVNWTGSGELTWIVSGVIPAATINNLNV